MLLIFIFIFLPITIFLNKNKISIFIAILCLILNLFNFDYTIDNIYILLLNQLLNLNSNVFVYTIFFYYCIWNNKIKKYLYVILIYLIIHNLNDFYNINFIVNENLYSINLNLLNGLFIIHPILIYLFLINYIVIVTIFNDLIYKYFYDNNINLLKYLLYLLSLTVSFLYNSIYFIATAIILGSWWATQELNWGSWWEWDLVEIINLYYLLLLIFFLHQNILFLLKSYNKFINNIIIITIFIFLVRYNLIHSIHNFINSSEFIQFYNYFFIGTLFIFILILNNNNNFNFNFKIYNALFCLYKYIILLILFTILYNYLGLDNLNLLNYFKIILSLYIALIVMFISIFNIKKIFFNFKLYIILNEFFMLIFNYKIITQLKILKILHNFIFIFIFILIINYINFSYVLNNSNFYNYYNNYNLIDNVVIYLSELLSSISYYFNNILNDIYLNYYFYAYNDSVDIINFKIIASFNNLSTWNEENLISYYKYTVIYINIFIYFLFIGNYKLVFYNTRKIY